MGSVNKKEGTAFVMLESDSVCSREGLIET